jgi:hypothetical protein
MKELLMGRKELFQGLKIGDLGYEFPIHPAVRLRMNYDKIVVSSDQLREEIIEDLKEAAEAEEVVLKANSSGRNLKLLLVGLSKKYSAGAVPD